MKIDSAGAPLRPARPNCCHSDARVPGQPAVITASRPLISIPSSSAFVVASARRLPERRRDSSSRRSSGRYPPRYDATDSVNDGSTSSRRSRVITATDSAALRLRTKARLWAPSTTRSASRSAHSAVAVRLMGAPFSPVKAVSSGSQRAMTRSPAGEPSAVTSSTREPTSRVAASPGWATVADAQMTIGAEPYDSQIRRSRRITSATCAPNTPRYA